MLEDGLAQVYLIRLYVEPLAPMSPKGDALLFHCHVLTPRGFIPCVDVLYRLLVQAQQSAAGMLRNTCQSAKQDSRLCVQRSLGGATPCKEDWVMVFNPDPSMTCFQSTSVDPLITVAAAVLHLLQFAM